MSGKSRALDLVGQRFDRLVVVERDTSVAAGHNRQARWVCVCDCGRQTSVLGANLRRRQARSCGCLVAERNREMRRTHGSTKSRAHRIWVQMRNRCRNPRNPNYRHYGGRGIEVCPEWDSFERFFEDMGEPPVGRTLDRIDVNGPYAPWNCRWATDSEQGRNRRYNHTLTLGDETYCVVEWAERLGIARGTLNSRLAKGWSVRRALLSPVDLRKSRRVAAPKATV